MPPDEPRLLYLAVVDFLEQGVFRTRLQSHTAFLLLQSKLPGQTAVRAGRNRLRLLMVGAAKSHRERSCTQRLDEIRGHILQSTKLACHGLSHTAF